MTFEEALDYLYKQLPMYQREGKSAFKKDLQNTEALCEILNQPQKNFKSIHIAGTNGKGSSAHMMASIFQEAGYKTALYTSPHLKDFRERIRINGEMISKKEVVGFIERYKSSFDKIKPSFFEWTVALAFQTFAKEKVDIAIIETGLGGRLDSTNVIQPELCLITNIGWDHMDMLGNTLDLIAMEKAGIIKANIPVVISEGSSVHSVFIEKAKELKAPIYFAENLKTELEPKTDLFGIYQKKNIRGVVQCWLILKEKGWNISQQHLELGLKHVVKNTKLRGRWDIIGERPTIIAETAHNEEGLTIALGQLKKNTEVNNLHFVLGFVKDKNLDNIIKLFPKESKYYFCAAKVPRALDINTLSNIAKNHGFNAESYSSVAFALDAAKENSKPNDTIYVGGSTFVVAEVL